jgi:3-mercaptopyruvate sulfurtransferase SseA
LTTKALRHEALGWVCALAVVAVAGTAGAVLRAQADASRMPLADFKKLADSGGVIILDVRSVDQFRAGHIPGALPVPLDTVAARASEWKSATKPIVTYCS